MSVLQRSPSDYAAAIRASELSIYDAIDIGSSLYIPSSELEILLNEGLKGFSTSGMPLRTRSKAVKTRICEVLGYPIPSSFRRTQPRFLGQNFDTYIQKSNNLQIWNEELSATRRYVLIREIDGVLSRVRVITGEILAELDTTGTLTQKFQARLVPGTTNIELVSATDTEPLATLLARTSPDSFDASPTDYPQTGKLMPVATVFERLRSLVGRCFEDLGSDQERNRGATLHRLICSVLGYNRYADDGRFPDVKHQLIEVKLQTSQTIDLGLVTPESVEPLDIPKVGEVQIRHCDVRYAIFEAATNGKTITIRGFYLTTGKDFFSRFTRFGGKVLNKKLQIPLPHKLFEAESLSNVLG